MIDIHMHILPGIDDGAQDLYDSLDMAVMAAESGITDIICTSHSNTDRWFAADYDYAFERLAEALKKEQIPVRIYPGMEIFMEEDSLALLANKHYYTLNHTRNVLIEFPFQINAEDAYYYIEQLTEDGYHPILAHAERFSFLQEQPDLLLQLKSMGCRIQLNKGTLSGAFGETALTTAKYALRQELIDFVATDAHDIEYRTPYMENAQKILQTCVSENYCRILLEENSKRILQNRK